MNKKIRLVTMLMVFVFLSGCGKKEGNQRQESIIEDVLEKESEQGISKEETSEEGGLEKDGQPETKNQDAAQESNARESFAFEDLSDWIFYFSSGVGGWGTELTIDSDGSFKGNYHDSDMGDMGEDYPNGTLYLCDFTGKFTNLEKVDDFTYKMKLDSLTFDQEPDKEEIIEGVRYIYSTAYGVDDGEDFYLYLPGSKLDGLPEEYLSWVGYYNMEAVSGTELPFYGLYNINRQNGFSSYEYQEPSLSEQIAVDISLANEWAGEAEAKLETATSQADMNMAGAELFQVWDEALNNVWGRLEAKLDPDTMEALREEEREWIVSKEAQVKAAGEEYEGGSMRSLVESTKAAELTKERVYELEKYAQYVQ